MFSDALKEAGKTAFIKMEPGQKIVVVFAGAPLEYMNNFELKEQFPMGLDTYPDKTSARFKINVLLPRDGKFFPWVFEGSKNVALALEAIVNKFGVDYLYEVQRTGSGKKTKYSILPERALTDTEKEQVKGVKLIELKLRPKIDDSFDADE